MMKSEQRGFTLVEIMLVLALLGMVLAAGWGVFTLAMKSWEVFQIRQEAEAAVRLTSMVITHELDYASFLEIRKENMWPADNNLNTGDRIIYTNVDGDKVFLSEYNGSNLTPSTIIETERCTLELSFKKPEYPVDSKTYLR
ncbi:MAG: type II secretion system protein, partial [Clostridiaceae bacterium]|nr:type II secretion system protein [Clostridiaceae bacterium]